LPVIKQWFFPSFDQAQDRRSSFEERERKEERGNIIALIKPQFEAGKKDVSRGDGVIRDPEIHRQVLLDVLNYTVQEGFGIQGLIKSPLLGPKGNAEFLVWLREQPKDLDIPMLVDSVLQNPQS